MNYRAIITNAIELGLIGFPILLGIILLFRSSDSYDESYSGSWLQRSGLPMNLNRYLKRFLGFILILFASALAYFLFLREIKSETTDKAKSFWEEIEAEEAALSLAFSFAIAIPARMSSKRFAGKPLAKLGGVPVLERVYQKCMNVELAKDKVYILTDSPEIMDFATSINAKAIMTSPSCNNGTERIVEALPKIDANFIVNVQGDEPFIPTELISSLMYKYVKTKCNLATAISKITEAKDLENPNVVKVLRNNKAKIIYFSRQALPFQREQADKSKWLENCDYFRHIGIYGYSREVLEAYNNLPKSILEENEFLEQLRFVDAGYNFDCVESEYLSIGIDTPEDLVEAEAYLKKIS